MKLVQIAVFIENAPGRLAEVCGLLGDAGINMRALSMGDSTDFGVLRIIANDPQKAKQVLRENGFTAIETEVLAVEIPDRPGGLAGVLKLLGSNGINVEYMYMLVTAQHEKAYVAFRFTDNDKAIKVLTESGVRILKGEEVYNI